MNTSGQKKIVVTPNKVLVTGAGLLGVAAIEKFLSAGWDVVGVSLRKPKLPSGRDIAFLSVDLRDEKAARAAFEPLTDITHIAYTAIHEKPELVAGWSSKEQIETNNDFAFAYGAPEGPRAFVSTIKLRQAGFTRTIDTEDSFRNGLQSLIDHKLLPPAAK